MDQNNSQSLVDLNTLTSSNSESSTTNLLWSENDETFLQNLFANTLLNDDFVEKPDFDLGLGFDNLQLNYDSNPTDTSNQLTILSLEDPVLNSHDLEQRNFISGSDLLIITDSKSENNDNDDKLFKKPSSDFITVNSLAATKPVKAKKKCDPNSETVDSLDNKLKRSMKRSKLLNAKNSTQDLIMSKSVPAGKHLKHRQQSLTNPNSTSGKNILKMNASNNKNVANFKQIQHKKNSTKTSFAISSNDQSLHLNSLNDLEKNIFLLKESSSVDTPTSSLVIKRDEFDLQIKELSLLDLHSSEDDSSNQDKKKQSQIKLNQNEAKSEISTKNKPANLTERSDNLNLSEIITKRIKYSQNSQINDQTGEETQSKATDTKADRMPNSKHKLDKFIQYFKSLDSSTKEPIILNQKNSKKSLDSLLSPPSPSNSQKTQNKRKKKDVQQTSNNNNDSSQRPIILISLQPEQHQSTPNNIPPLVQPTSQPSHLTINLENDTLLHMKNLDLNTEQTTHHQNTNNSRPSSESNSNNTSNNNNNNISLNLSDKNSRNYLWNLLKTNSTQEELLDNFGSCLHDKISFWDLVQLKLKYSKSNHLKTTYEIIDDYTLLYSNMSALLERFVNEQSNFNSLMAKSDSSRSRSSSRNVRKQSTSGSNR